MLTLKQSMLGSEFRQMHAVIGWRERLPFVISLFTLNVLQVEIVIGINALTWIWYGSEGEVHKGARTLEPNTMCGIRVELVG